MLYASFGRRVAAHFLDVLPITIVVATIAHQAFGYEIVRSASQRRAADAAAEEQYFARRAVVRDVTFVVRLIYGAVMEFSSWQATFGKRMLQLAVVDLHGRRLSFRAALVRNLAKYLSTAALGLGFLWMLWSPKHQTWHDMIAKSYVLWR